MHSDGVMVEWKHTCRDGGRIEREWWLIVVTTNRWLFGGGCKLWGNWGVNVFNYCKSTNCENKNKTSFNLLWIIGL